MRQQSRSSECQQNAMAPLDTAREKGAHSTPRNMVNRHHRSDCPRCLVSHTVPSTPATIPVHDADRVQKSH